MGLERAGKDLPTASVLRICRENRTRNSNSIIYFK